MPKRSDIAQLPPAVRDWLDKALVNGGFGGYRALADELKTRGYDISKSAVHRYGREFETKLSAFKNATEAARAVVETCPDDEGVMGDALIRLVQQKTFDLLLELEIDPSKLKLTSIGEMVAKLSSASVQQKKWMMELRAKTQAAAAEVEKVARAGGTTDATIERIKALVLGIGA